MSQSASSFTVSESGAASVDAQPSPLLRAREQRDAEGAEGSRVETSGCGPGLIRVRSHALFLNDAEAEMEQMGEERIIVPKQISLAAGSLDLQYDTGSCALQGVSSKMEDRVLVYDLSYHAHFSGCQRAVLVAVLDGHAGSDAVSYLETHLAQHVLEEVALQIGCPPVFEIPQLQPQQQQHSHSTPHYHDYNHNHNHHHQQGHPRHSQQGSQPYQPPHARHQQQQQQQQEHQQADASEAPIPLQQQQQQEKQLVKQRLGEELQLRQQDSIQGLQQQRQPTAVEPPQQQQQPIEPQGGHDSYPSVQDHQQPVPVEDRYHPHRRQHHHQQDQSGQRPQQSEQQLPQLQELLPPAREKGSKLAAGCETTAAGAAASRTIPSAFTSDCRTSENVRILATEAAPASPAATAAAAAAVAFAAATAAMTAVAETSNAAELPGPDLGAFDAEAEGGEGCQSRSEEEGEEEKGKGKEEGEEETTGPEHADMPDAGARASSNLSLGIRTPVAAGPYDWDLAEMTSSYGFDEWAAEDDEDGLYGDGPWAPPLNHSAAAARRRSSLAAYDSGFGCQPPDPPAALRNALLRCERELMEQDCHSGTTALVALMLGASLWLANVGDCRAVVCDDGEARQLTVDHKAGAGRSDAGDAVCGAALLERQRLLSLGVQLSSDGYLLVTAPDGSCSDIAVSRNLGCAHLKNRSFSGRGSSYLQLYPPNLQPQTPHMHVQRQSTRSAWVSSGSSVCGGMIRISASGAAAAPVGFAAGGLSTFANRVVSAGNMDWGHQQHRQQNQERRHHHRSAPESVSGSLDDLIGLKSEEEPHPPGVNQHSHHQHNHHHDRSHLHSSSKQYQQQQEQQQQACGRNSSNSVVGEGGVQEPPWQVWNQNQSRHQRHSSQTQLQTNQGGSAGRFDTRSDPSILTFSPPLNKNRQQQQPSLQEGAPGRSVNSGGGLSQPCSDMNQQGQSGLYGPKDDWTQQDVNVNVTASAPGPSEDGGCGAGSIKPETADCRCGGGSDMAVIPPPPPTLPRINTGPVPSVGPSGQSPSLLPQQQQQQQYQGLSPRPPRPRNGGSTAGSSRGCKNGVGMKVNGSPQLQVQSAQMLSMAKMVASLSIDECYSPTQVRTPTSDATSTASPCTAPAPATVAAAATLIARAKPRGFPPSGETGSGSGSRPGSRPGYGTVFVNAQLNGGVGSGHSLGLPPLPSSPPVGSGSGAGVQLSWSGAGRQYFSHRRSGSGGGDGGGLMRERCLLPASPFCPLMSTAGGSYYRLSPLEECGSNSSGVEGISPSNGGVKAVKDWEDGDVGSPICSMGPSVCSALIPMISSIASDSVDGKSDNGGRGKEPPAPFAAESSEAVAAAAAATTKGVSPDEVGENCSLEGAVPVLKTAVTFSAWTLDSAFIHTVSAELAATVSTAAAEERVQESSPTTPEAPAAAVSSTAAAEGRGTRRSSGTFGSGAALSEASGGACSSAAGVLIPDPDLFYYEISQDSEFLICACDGLWDVMRNGEACRYVRRWLADGRSAAGAAEDLCRAALRMGSHDNISVVVLRFSGRPLVRPETSSRLRRAASEAQL